MNNNTIPHEVVIIGGGKSIEKAFPLLVSDPLLNKFVITVNYAYRDFNSTFLAFQDKNFYVPDYAKEYVEKNPQRHPDIYEELKKLPLIIGINNNGISEFQLPNTILLNTEYRANLTGVFALKILELLKFEGIIYLLGFDWPRRIGLRERDPNYNPNSDLQIHYYDLKHKGSGYVGYYENHNPDKEFKKFIKDNVKIYNVSPESNIECFEKIDYPTFLNLLNHQTYNQEELRQVIREKLCIK